MVTHRSAMVLATVDSLIMAIIHTIWILSIVMGDIMVTISVVPIMVIIPGITVDLGHITHLIIVRMVIILVHISGMQKIFQPLMAGEKDLVVCHQAGTEMFLQPALREEILTCHLTGIQISAGELLQEPSKFRPIPEELYLRPILSNQLARPAEY